jgi:predicted TIM-barrel fold metal-dependent hydrolase
MCFPSFAGMDGIFFARCQDRELALASLQAYNDWHIDEWAGSHPGRFIPLPLCAVWSPELSAQEVRRVARKGATAIAFSEAPESYGYPSIHSGAWDPFFAACQEEDMVVAIHIASSNMTRLPMRRSRWRSGARCRAGTRSRARRTCSGPGRS